MTDLTLETCTSVLKLTPDNFVPFVHTPWAGVGLASSFKAPFVPKDKPDFRIGESWEFSVNAAYPSRVVAPESLRGKLLADMVTGEILVKLISTGEPLSYQVHPADAHPLLDAKSCGKSESWLVLAAEPGAGVYIGLKRPWTQQELRAALTNGSFSQSDLHFVPVEVGDFFDIAPGVTHALGPGLVIYEPQRIHAGRSGVTWRLWDWNRRYAADGVTEDRGGTPRSMHIDQGLSVFNPEHQTGEVLERQARRYGQASTPRPGVTLTSWQPNSFYSVHRLSMAAETAIGMHLSGGYASAVQLRGEVEASGAPSTTGKSRWCAGETLTFSRAALPLQLKCVSGPAEILMTCPVSAQLSLHVVP